MAENANTGPIKTVSDMFRALEDEINAVKSGSLPLDTARVVQRGRALQLKTAELNLQFQRINKAQRGPGREVNLITGATEETLTDNIAQENQTRPS